MSRVLLLQFLLEVLAVGAIFAALPRIARRGLLFGVYVGTEGSLSEAARAVTAAWYRSMVGVIVGTLALFFVTLRLWSEAGALFSGSHDARG